VTKPYKHLIAEYTAMLEELESQEMIRTNEDGYLYWTKCGCLLAIPAVDNLLIQELWATTKEDK